jgi:hypothetical protein
MKLSELLVEVQFNESEGIALFFDKKQKVFRVATDEDNKAQTITNVKDYKKIAKRHKVDMSSKEWANLKKETKGNKDRRFQDTLDAMEADLKNI